MSVILSVTTSQEKIREKAAKMTDFFAIPVLRAPSSFSAPAVVSVEPKKIETFSLILELPVRPEVSESLEQSLNDHAEIWAQLS